MTSEQEHLASEALWFGIFIDESFEGTLDHEIERQHITFGFKVTPPADIDWNAEYPITVTGYGNDGINEGYCCDLPSELEQLYHGAEIPHITVSVAENGKPVDTQFLDFESLNESFIIYGKFGYYSHGRYYI